MSVVTNMRAAWVDELLAGKELVANLAQNARFAAPEGTSRPGSADQALASAVLHFLSARGHGHLLVGLPRGQHDLATFCGLVLQIARTFAWSSGRFHALEAFSGPVLVVGTDTSVQRRLRATNIRGARFGGGLAEALSACRVRADGSVVTPSGDVVPYEGGERRLLYMNTRIGWPSLKVYDGVAVLDRTHLSTESYRKALDWVQSRFSRIITVASIGDVETSEVLAELDLQPASMLFTPGVVADLYYALGSGEGQNSLSINSLVAKGVDRHAAWDPSWEMELIEAPHIDDVLSDAFSALAAAQSVDRRRRPQALKNASQLVSTLIRCPVDVGQYSKVAAQDPWIKAPRSLSLSLERHQARFHGKWQSFGTTHWGRLRHAAVKLYGLLEQDNPKADAVTNTVHKLRRENPAARIRIRVANSLTSPLLVEALQQAGVDDGRVEVLPWSNKTPWLSADIEVWASAPPWTQTPHAFGAESNRKVAVVYEAEASVLQRRTLQVASSINELISQTRDDFGVHDLPSEAREWLMPDSEASRARAVSATVDLDRVADRVSDLLAQVPDTEVPDQDRTELKGEAASLVPVRFADGSTWWVHPERAVGLLVGEKYRHALVAELRADDVVVVPRGEGRDEIFSRLVQAKHATEDMSDLDILLGRFRLACRQLWKDSGENWAAVQRKLEQSGAHATTQARAWAEGATIAPEDPQDVKLIGKLVGDARLESGWASVAGIAGEIRSVHQQLGHMISQALTEVLNGRIGASTEKLERLLGEDAVEILDEFMLKQIVEVGDAEEVDARLEGQLSEA